MAKIFISYRRSETQHVAGRLRDRLAAHFGPGNVHLDIDTVGAGVDYVPAIEHAITSCQILVALVGPSWTVVADRQGRRVDNPHDPVVMEIRAAFENRIRIIPVLIDGAPMPHHDDLPAAIHVFSRLNALRLDHETFRTDAEQLIAGIEQALPEAGPHPQRPAQADASLAGPGDHRASVWPPWGLRDVAPLRGRDELVAEVMNHDVGNAATSRVWVLHGLGGVGKTRVALEVAFQTQRSDADVWWVSAIDTAEFVPGMYAVAELIGVDLERLRHVAPADALWAALAARDKRWLLVIDNADDPGAVLTAPGHAIGDGTSWVRSVDSRGLVLITSRTGNPKAWGGGVELRPVTALSSSTGGQILIDLAPASGSLDNAERLAQRLGGLPLALHLAGAALAEAMAMPPILTGDSGLPATFAEYGQALDEQLTMPLPSTFTEFTADPHQVRQLVGQTWEVSLTQLSSAGFPDARPLLRLLACLGNAPIPYGLLLDPGILAGSSLFPDITGRRLWDVLLALDGLNLITLGDGHAANPIGFTVTLHPLVRETNAVHLNHSDASEYSVLAARLIAACAENPASEADDSPETWPRWLALAPHVFHVLQHLETAKGCDSDVAAGACRAATLAARCHFGSGLYEQAETELRLVLKLACPLLGEQHYEVLATRHQLARVLHERGQLAQAAAELEIVLKARRRTLGEERRATLATRNQLAWTLRGQGLLDEAQQELEALVNDKTRVLGPEDPDTVVARMDLAQVWHEQGRYERAAAEYVDVLAMRRRILGDDHRKTLNTRHDLAQLWYDLGEFAQAATAYTEVLAARRRILGEDHPDTLATRHNLATALNKLGQP